MKRNELQKCAMCHEGLMHAGLPIFFRLRVEGMGIDLDAIRRRHGLELVLGGGHSGAALAQVMGTDEDLAITLGEPIEILICQPCSIKDVSVAFLAELKAVRT